MSHRMVVTFVNPAAHEAGQPPVLIERILAPEFDGVDREEHDTGLCSVHVKWSDRDGGHAGEAFFANVVWYRLDDLESRIDQT